MLPGIKTSKILFYIFVFLLPWQTRLILFPENPELLGFSVYLSEIFLWLALVFWLTNADLKKIKIPFVFSFFCFFVSLSVLWSPDKVAAFRAWLYIFEGIMVYLYLREHNEIWRRAAKIFLFSLFIAAIFGIWQFFNLGSESFKWLGLATRGAWNLGDIVVASDGARFLRAYGPFPHPNIFGGYLAAGILLAAIILSEPKGESKGRWLLIYFLGAVLFFALFLTFSRSAWLALAFALIYFLIKNPRKDFLKFFIFLSALALVFYGIFAPLVKTRIGAEGRLEIKSNTERVASWKDGITAWKQNPFFGSGLGNNVIASDSEAISSKMGSPRSLQSLAMTKQSEPAHNIFILILSQLGIAGFLIYLFVWKKIWKNKFVRPLLILFFIIGLFDHYLWTLYSGQILFWLGLSLNQIE